MPLDKNSAILLSRKMSLSLPAGVVAPRYDLCALTPGIVHIGVGGFQRSHFARYAHDLLEQDSEALNWGIVASGLRASDQPLIGALNRQDGLYTLVERDASGETATLIGSILRAIDASASTSALLAAMAHAEIKIVTITVSEAGYHLDNATKALDLGNIAIRRDIANPREPRTVLGVLVEAFRQRRDAGMPAFTALSCDNIQHNGRVLLAAVLTLAEQVDLDLAAWIASHARFPSSMVDRITPVPTREEIKTLATQTGIADDAAVFSESFRQWVIEDDFADGRPDWSRVGAQLVPDVAPYEAMKLRLLNASHLAIAGLGTLSGYATVEQTMSDPAIRQYMKRLMDIEICPLLAPVPGIDLEKYKVTLVARFANPAIRDTLRRINTDAPINLLLDPLRDALAVDAPIDFLSLGLAAWCLRTSNELLRGETITGANANSELQRHTGDPLAILFVKSLFGDVGSNRRFVSTVRLWLDALNDKGVAQVLRIVANT